MKSKFRDAEFSSSFRKLGALGALVTGGFFAVAVSAHGQTPLNACDLAAPFGTVNSADVTAAVNMVLGVTPCTANILGANVCDVVVVQRVSNAASTGTCVTGNAHSVTLNWVASTSSGVAGYNIYRGSVFGGPYGTKVNASLIQGITYSDTSVQAGQTYYYIARAVDASGTESADSGQAQAVVPFP